MRRSVIIAVAAATLSVGAFAALPAMTTGKASVCEAAVDQSLTGEYFPRGAYVIGYRRMKQEGVAYCYKRYYMALFNLHK